MDHAQRIDCPGRAGKKGRWIVIHSVMLEGPDWSVEEVPDLEGERDLVPEPGFGASGFRRHARVGLRRTVRPLAPVSPEQKESPLLRWPLDPEREFAPPSRLWWAAMALVMVGVLAAAIAVAMLAGK